MTAKSRLSSPILLPRPRLLAPKTTLRRRHVLQAIGLAPLSALWGCASLLGEETIEAYFTVGKNSGPDFYGWTEYHFSDPVAADQGAELRHVQLSAPSGASDLTFVTSLLAEAVQPDGTRTPLAQGGGFPKNDTLAQLDVLYEDNLRPLMYPDGSKLRIEWNGTFDPTYPYPPGGIRVDARITVEIL